MNEVKNNVNVFWKLINNFTGQIELEGSVHNTIVDNGLEQLEKLAGGISADYFDDIAIGTSSTAVQTTDSALIAEFDREEATNTHTGGKMQWVYTFTFPSGTSETIQEIGVFNGASVMMNRALTGAIAVDSTKTLAITVTLNGTRA
jgi:hypothetical protein